jgi:hypothetical protein
MQGHFSARRCRESPRISCAFHREETWGTRNQRIIPPTPVSRFLLRAVWWNEYGKTAHSNETEEEEARTDRMMETFLASMNLKNITIPGPVRVTEILSHLDRMSDGSNVVYLW